MVYGKQGRPEMKISTNPNHCQESFRSFDFKPDTCSLAVPVSKQNILHTYNFEMNILKKEITS